MGGWGLEVVLPKGGGGEYSRGKDKQTIKTNIFKGSLKHI